MTNYSPNNYGIAKNPDISYVLIKTSQEKYTSGRFCTQDLPKNSPLRIFFGKKVYCDYTKEHGLVISESVPLRFRVTFTQSADRGCLYCSGLCKVMLKQFKVAYKNGYTPLKMSSAIERDGCIFITLDIAGMHELSIRKKRDCKTGIAYSDISIIKDLYIEQYPDTTEIITDFCNELGLDSKNWYQRLNTQENDTNRNPPA